MTGLNFDTWNNAGGFLFKKQRIYRAGKWTPFIRMQIRYKGAMLWKNLLWGLTGIKL